VEPFFNSWCLPTRMFHRDWAMPRRNKQRVQEELRESIIALYWAKPRQSRTALRAPVMIKRRHGGREPCLQVRARRRPFVASSRCAPATAFIASVIDKPIGRCLKQDLPVIHSLESAWDNQFPSVMTLVERAGRMKLELSRSGCGSNAHQNGNEINQNSHAPLHLLISKLLLAMAAYHKVNALTKNTTLNLILLSMHG
jgi:hypothetical protein